MCYLQVPIDMTLQDLTSNVQCNSKEGLDIFTELINPSNQIHFPSRFNQNFPNYWRRLNVPASQFLHFHHKILKL